MMNNFIACNMCRAVILLYSLFNELLIFIILILNLLIFVSISYTVKRLYVLYIL